MFLSQICCTAVDCSEAACHLTYQNAQRYGVSDRLLILNETWSLGLSLFYFSSVLTDTNRYTQLILPSINIQYFCYHILFISKYLLLNFIRNLKILLAFSLVICCFRKLQLIIVLNILSLSTVSEWFGFTDIISKLRTNERNYDFLISNPPYIPAGDIEKLPPDISKYGCWCCIHLCLVFIFSKDCSKRDRLSNTSTKVFNYQLSHPLAYQELLMQY